MPDAEQIDPTRDRVWAVDVSVSFTTYVVAETAEEAERIAKHSEIDLDPDFTASEMAEPPSTEDGIVPHGRSLWEGRDLTLVEAVELVAAYQPAYDDQTELMPFAAAPPPLYPAQIDDYLAGQEPAR